MGKSDQLRALGAVGVAFVALLPVLAQPVPGKKGGVGRYAVILYDVLAAPRWDTRVRVPGFSVALDTLSPGGDGYDVSVNLKFRRGGGAWQWVPARPDPRG